MHIRLRTSSLREVLRYGNERTRSRLRTLSNLKLYVMKDGLKTHADSLAYVDKLKAIYAQDETNEVVLDGLNSMFSSLKMEKEQMELLDAAIAKNPNNFVALANKGMVYIQKNDADNAIKCLKQALDAKPDNVVVLTYLGACYNSKAGNLQDPNGRKVVTRRLSRFSTRLRSSTLRRHRLTGVTLATRLTMASTALQLQRPSRQKRRASNLGYLFIYEEAGQLCPAFLF